MKKPIIEVKDLTVGFFTHGKKVDVIRNISLNIYPGETLAIVGESGSGKSVFTKTFTGMLDSNGYIKHGEVMFDGMDLAKFDRKGGREAIAVIRTKDRVEHLARIEEIKLSHKKVILEAEKTIKENNLSKEEADKLIQKAKQEAKDSDIKEKEEIKGRINVAKQMATDAKREYNDRLVKIKKTAKENELSKSRKRELRITTKQEIKQAKKHFLLERKEVKLVKNENSLVGQELNEIKIAYLNRKKELEQALKEQLHKVELNVKKESAIAKQSFLKKRQDSEHLLRTASPKGKAQMVWLEKKEANNILEKKMSWPNIRGKRIATIFQDPMTSLNPLFSIGFQISEVLIKHHGLSRRQAKAEAIRLLEKVRIPNAAKRYKDYPFQYSGGMRQRVVIAIALACRPEILICDEPTTALDVTVQNQILDLIKELQREYKWTTIFITHDLGVVANIADRIAVMYGGQVVEYGTSEDVFYAPAHPYTWALLSSLPQLGIKGEPLSYIPGNPPTFSTEIIGDAYATRNVYALMIDRIKEPPMFKISDTHFAKTWLLDPRAPAIEKPIVIQELRQRMEMAAKELKRETK